MCGKAVFKSFELEKVSPRGTGKPFADVTHTPFYWCSCPFPCPSFAFTSHRHWQKWVSHLGDGDAESQGDKALYDGADTEFAVES